MIRRELNRPSEPPRGSTAGPVSGFGRRGRGWCFRVAARAALALAIAALLAGPAVAGPRPGRPGDPPEGLVTEIRFEGNRTISAEQIRGRIKSRVGRELDKRIQDEDVRSLSATKWFSDVQIEYEPDARGDGIVLVFVLAEMTKLSNIEFIGIHKLKQKEVEEACDLRPGGRADAQTVLMASRRIQNLYIEKGYETAQVKLLEGGKPGDARVVIEIFEGEKFRIGSIKFVGNSFVEDSVLGTKIESRKGFIGTLGEKRFKDGYENDRRALIRFYQDHGFLDVDVQYTVKHGSSLGDEQVTFTISEKTRYKVRNIVFEGNEKIPTETLKQGLLLKPDAPFEERLREMDHKTIMSRYWGIGCIKTRADKDQKIIDDPPGLVDVVYHIEEGSPFYLGQLLYAGNAHTKDKVFRREAAMAGLLPGEVLDLNRVEKYRQRVLGTGYVVKDNQPNAAGKGLEIKIKNERPGDKPYGDVAIDPLADIPGRMQSPDEPAAPGPGAASRPAAPLDLPMPTRDGATLPRKRPVAVPAALLAQAAAERSLAATRAARMQSQDPELTLPGSPPSLPPLDAAGGVPETPPPAPVVGDPVAPGAPGTGQPGLTPFGSSPGSVFDPAPNTVPPLDVAPLPPPTTRPGEDPGPNPKIPATGGPVDRGDRNPGLFPNIPNGNMVDVGPDRQEPFPNRSFADIVTSLDEAPSGRLMLGVGASSFGGLNGNIILHESNFDLFALPRSWGELTSGRAFKGAGQEFRIELSPGTLINRYVVSFRDPYLFDLPIGLGVSGYQWSRYYPDWSERRSGGRFSLGYQYGPQTYADVAFRIEDVDIHGFKYPAPADLLSAAGHTTLATIRPALRFDNRNNPTAPTEGSYLEGAFEQGFGTYMFPKVTVEGRQHFTLGSRPDNTGKRTLALRGFVGATGRDTPIYERFYAGDFRSMRGFYYRGVGPHNLGVNTGGVFTAIGSVEYQFPWNASDTIQQVVFCDFGTVEADYRVNNVRAAIGTGFRVVIPQITGQLPLAFDLAFPIEKAEGDHVRYFTFFIGAFW